MAITITKVVKHIQKEIFHLFISKYFRSCFNIVSHKDNSIPSFIPFPNPCNVFAGHEAIFLR